MLQRHLRIRCRSLFVVDPFQTRLACLGQLQRAHIASLGRVRIAKTHQNVVRVAELRIGIDHRLVTRNGRRPVLAGRIVVRDVGLAGRKNLLHLAQPLLRLRNQCRLRELLQHQPVLLLRMDRLRIVAVGLVHLPEVDVTHTHLGLGSFRSVGEEGDEVLVLALGLRQRGSSALAVPAVSNRQLRLHLVLRVRIGVQHRLQIQTGDVEVSLLGGFERLVVELPIGKLRIGGSLRIDLLVPLNPSLGVLGLDNLVFFFGLLA